MSPIWHFFIKRREYRPLTETAPKLLSGQAGLGAPKPTSYTNPFFYGRGSSTLILKGFSGIFETVDIEEGE